MSFGGPCGLDYPAVKLIADAYQIDFDDTLPYLQRLEVARLNWWNDKRKAEEAEAKRKERRG